ncbi:YtxH domain-containing protein [Leifsonia sp. 2MCAF36]|uniref:YtxH domain-containing protein n=1 Tax=Leifsonia sp. 2MCAF36 TaxID=3232988 RepID=UPI003F95240B
MSDIPEDDEQLEETVTPAQVRVRRSPRYFRFMITGAVIFAIVALILTFSFPENPTYDRGSVFGFLLAIGVIVGVALGAVVALLVDRSTGRRARSVQADRIDVRVPEPGTSPARQDGSQPEPGTQNDSTSDTQS